MPFRQDPNPAVTPDHFRKLREVGFVAYRDESSRLWFAERDEYRWLVEAGKIKSGSSVQ